MAVKMADRYISRRIGTTAVVMYNYGKYMEVQCNGSSGRTIIINQVSDKHIEYQFNEIFGLGEYKKFSKYIISHSREKNTNNPHSIKHTIIADYLPKQAKKDIERESLPDKKEDLIGKYFKGKKDD